MLVQGGAVATVIGHRDGDLRQQPPDRCDVEAGVLEPPGQVPAQRALGCPSDRALGGQGGVGERAGFGGDLGRGIAPADHDEPLPGERAGAAVVGGVQHPAAEVRPPARNVRNKGCAVVTGRGDDRPRGELPPVIGPHGPSAPGEAVVVARPGSVRFLGPYSTRMRVKPRRGAGAAVAW